MNKKYIVRLTDAERCELMDLVSKGNRQAYIIKHANILLAVDADGPKWSDEIASKAFRCDINTVRNLRRRFVEQGLAGALRRKRQEAPSRARIIDGDKEARLLAIACSKPPQGRTRWTLELLAEELVVQKIVDSVSAQTVCRALKKMNLSPICGSIG